jgi:methylmalonyl-CoA mutase, N-terminal domain
VQALTNAEIGSETRSGLPVAAVYTAADLAATDPDAQLDLAGPGEFPFTRGVRPGMYRDQLWVMGLYSGAASPQETNRRIRHLLSQGQKGFSIALDLPTQLGLDSDDPKAASEVGVVGVPLDTVDDMIALLEGVPLDQVRQMRTTANSIGPIAVGLYVVAAEELGYSADNFRVMLQNDVLKEYSARGTQIFPPLAGLRFSVDVMEHCARHLPHWEPIEFCGYHLRDAGSTAVQEVAIACANGLAYIEEAMRRGLSIDEIGHHFVMFLCAHIDIFEEAAKFRAARRLWARLIQERYRPQLVDPCRLDIFSYTLGSVQTAQEPLNNIVRIAYQALAAILGGAQTLATSSYDEALELPSDEAAHIALRTQQILAYETGVPRSADPLGGSYLVESMTTQLEHAICAYIEQIESHGGAVAVLESGWLASELEREAYRQQKRIEAGDQPVVGVNCFVSGPTPAFQSRPAREDVEHEQIQRLLATKRSRDQAAAHSSLDRVRQAAADGTNTVEPIIAALRARASIGEIVKELKSVWGSFDRR